MSTSTATRAPRLTPPAAPTRKAAPRRRTVAQGACVVGGAGRPVLRIVADDELAPVVTRIPALAPGGPVETAETPIRKVDLDDFFVPEYAGDEVGVRVARRQPSTLRLTRRGRLAVFGVGLVAVLGLGVAAATGSLANDKPEPTRVVTVQPGQTLWDIASQADARTGGADVRAMLSHLEAVNHLDSTTLQVGQTLRVPK